MLRTSFFPLHIQGTLWQQLDKKFDTLQIAVLCLLVVLCDIVCVCVCVLISSLTAALPWQNTCAQIISALAWA